MKDELITFETAKLAKEKGFDIPVFMFYHNFCKDKALHNNGCKKAQNNKGENYNADNFKKLFNITDKYIHYSAPTQSLLQKWLREEHKIILTVGYVYEYDSTPYTFFIYNEGHSSPINAWVHDYKTYESALEEGLKNALNEI